MTPKENELLHYLLMKRQLEILDKRSAIATRMIDDAIGLEIPHNKIVSILPVVDKEEYKYLKQEYDALETILTIVFGKKKLKSGKVLKLSA